MKRDSFIMHLLDGCGCTLVREDKKGYIVVRNPENKRFSGVPKAKDDGTIRQMTICKICTHLQITVPEVVKHFQPFIDLIDKTSKKED